MRVTDDVTGNTSIYHVTRDAPILNKDNPVNEANGFLEFFGLDEDTYNVKNTAFEPKGDKGEYVGTALSYPDDTGLEAINLRNADGTDDLNAEPAENDYEPREDENKATGVMSVSKIEESGLSLLGYNIVNVAQKFDINISSKGNVSISAATDVFPSATLKENGSTIMQYNQPSFKDTHTQPIKTQPLPFLPPIRVTKRRSTYS